jgi:hypothetical protein
MKGFSPAIAEKILVSGYIVLFALAYWWVLEVVRPGSEHFLVWGLVFGGNWFLSMGFYNFCYGLVFSLFSFGFWLKWRKSFGAWQWLVLFLLATLLYFTHFFWFFMAALLIGIVGLVIAWREARQPDDQSKEWAPRFQWSTCQKSTPRFAYRE